MRSVRDAHGARRSSRPRWPSASRWPSRRLPAARRHRRDADRIEELRGRRGALTALRPGAGRQGRAHHVPARYRPHRGHVRPARAGCLRRRTASTRARSSSSWAARRATTAQAHARRARSEAARPRTRRQRARARRRRQRLLRHAEEGEEAEAHHGVRPEEDRAQAHVRRAAGMCRAAAVPRQLVTEALRVEVREGAEARRRRARHARGAPVADASTSACCSPRAV